MITTNSRLCAILTLLLLGLSAIAIETQVSLANSIPASTVGHSNDTEDTLGNWIRHNFWAKGLHWVFWSSASSGGNLLYSTSGDGTVWSAATTLLGPGINSDTFAPIWFNGTHLMYTAWNINGACPLVFRLGIPQSNGSISWAAPQQTITSSCVIYSDIKTDSNGYVWVTFTTLSDRHTHAVRNLSRSGSWQNGTVYQLDQSQFFGWLPTSIVPLSNGQVFFEYNSNSCATTGMFGRLWNGTTMLPQETITNQCPTALGYSSAIGVGATVYLSFGESGGSVHFMRRLPNGTWTPDFLVQSSGNTTMVSMTLNETSNLILFWQGGNPANTVFYRSYSLSSNQWSPTVTWFVDPEGFTLENGIYSRPGSFFTDYGNSTVRYIGFQYSTKSLTPYDVRYAFLSFTLKSTAIFTQIFPSVNVTAR